MAKPGRLVVIIGPMFAGKTTKLIGELRKEQKRKRRTIVFKADFDSRYSSAEVVSHDGVKVPAYRIPTTQKSLGLIRKISESYEVIALDEGHFWTETEGMADLLNELAFSSKIVYVSMLSTGMWGEPFKIGKELIPLADKVYSLEAKCAKCGKGNAIFTQRVAPYKEGASMADMVGGAKEYQPRCRLCFEQRKMG
ncbi:MAG: thymidine kinase [Candidatus Micrarchaeota archaeon]|nr:thymidine kinase [Candidatus Micrarchaeota archaeon]MDE1834014.1 thymidine kinase [Candidatus Micrarchaeota archaeon]MDE1859477.1 thymidine kinase [Candidatus Micrarchaeota archaeon]